ncbi:GfV-B47-ORF1 [Ichnoviriform fumiferanae]|uniref:GfV-B47-ORF1 n=1 Tax=Ichnoviriform fumiferanae TaxID=419435 RepID=A2PZU4_9VIRU|nr:GfV-B47-ORF1 [Ichnoviriform fumiferanae]BAF45516.1 GfV-B47-ORF1 [Ichnoviriform fumiferanae]
MDYCPSRNELIAVVDLVCEINEYSKFLAKFRAREQLGALFRGDLVQLQIEKAKLIAQLKMAVRNWTVVPQSVRDIYF